MAYAFVRLSLALYAEPRTFPTSWRFRWHATNTTEPFGVAALYSLAKTPTGAVVVQTCLAVGCWVWMLRELLRAFARHSVVGKGLVGFLSVASLSAPIVVWDRSLLPESLKLSVVAALAAAWMMVQRRRGDRFAKQCAFAVLVSAALVSSVVFIFLAVPVAVATTYRVWRFRGLAVLSVAVVVLAGLAFWPSTIQSGPVQSTAFSQRTMNVVGERVLPDPYLRRRLLGAELAKTLDPSLFRSRSGVADDYVLFRTPEIRRFARSLSTVSYMRAVMARPSEFAQVSLDAVAGTLATDSPDIGVEGDEVISRSVSNVLWGWSAPFNIALLTLALVAVGVLPATSRGQRPPHRFLRGAISMAILATVGASVVVWTNGSDVKRELLVFLVAGRLSWVVCAITVTTIWVRRFVVLDETGVGFVGLPRTSPLRRQIKVGGRMAFLIGLAVALLASIVGSTMRSHDGIRLRAPSASGDLVRSVETNLRGRNVVVTKQVHNMLVAILYPWETRDDLQATLSNPDGTPNIEALTLWARRFPDSSTESFAIHLGAIDEIRSRLSLISPDTGIVPVLYWTLKNEPSLDRDYTTVISHIADFWNTRPALQAELLVGGKVDVLGLLKAANDVAADAPEALNTQYDFFSVRQAIYALEQDNE